jgi:hypothetical protein
MVIVFDLVCSGMNGGKNRKAKTFQCFCCGMYSIVVFK